MNWQERYAVHALALMRSRSLLSIAIVLGRSGRGGLAAVDAISWVQLALRDSYACAIGDKLGKYFSPTMPIDFHCSTAVDPVSTVYG
ncbi:hypothetical protein [Scytonema millei]|uniref:hypothetical protein n=1 Tax=Scytonema millei TaxID=1245922 RepID=UPI00398C070B